MTPRRVPPRLPDARGRLKRPPPLPTEQPGRPEWRYLSPRDLRKLKNLFFAARIIVEGMYTGKHKSPYKGSSPEFVDYREYYPGDEIRTIDWKAFARTDRYFIKLFEKETNMDCYILVDKSASMDYGGRLYQEFFPTPEISKLDYAFYLTAALAYLLVKQGDKVSVALFDQKLRTYIPTGGTFPHLYHILNTLEHQKAGNKTSVSQVLRDVYPIYRRKGLLILISDLLDEPEEIFKALDMYRHRRFDIILFHVMHRYEYALPPIDSIKFIDLEMGESIISRTDDIRDAYNQEIQEFIRKLSAFARARNIDYNFISTETPYSVVLQKYLLKRNGS